MTDAVQVVGHGTAVDQQHSPVVVSVHRVGMVLERRVQYLSQPRDRGMPRTNRIGHARNVQDPHRATAQNRSMTSIASALAHDAAPFRFDTKVAVVLRDDLAPWQELNVTAFLMSGIANSESGLVGEPYRDGDGNEYLPMLRQPVLVMSAHADFFTTARSKAAAREDIALAVYTSALFTTTHDEANRATVAAVSAGDLDLVGIAVRGPKNAIDRLLKGAHMHA